MTMSQPRFAEQRLPYPELIRLPGDPGFRLEEAAGERVVSPRFRLRVNVAATDTDRRRTEEAMLLGRRVIGDVDEANLNCDAKLTADAFDERKRRMVVRAAVEIEDLDERASLTKFLCFTRDCFHGEMVGRATVCTSLHLGLLRGGLVESGAG